MMLRHMGLHDHANKIQTACFDTIKEKKVRLELKVGHSCVQINISLHH